MTKWSLPSLSRSPSLSCSPSLPLSLAPSLSNLRSHSPTLYPSLTLSLPLSLSSALSLSLSLTLSLETALSLSHALSSSLSISLCRLVFRSFLSLSLSPSPTLSLPLSPAQGEEYSNFFRIRRLVPSIYRSPPKNIRNFKHPQKISQLCPLTLKKDPKMHRMTLKLAQFCDDPKKYPQNLHTPQKYSFF